MSAENASRIIACGKCGQRMRVLSSATARVYKCVKCGALVEDAAAGPPPAEVTVELAKKTRPADTADPFAMLLREAGLATPEQIAEALRIQGESGGKLFDILIRAGHLKREDLHALMSRQGGVASLSLAFFTLDRELTNILPRDLVVQHFVLPIDKLGRLLTVAMVCPTDMEAISEIQKITKLRVKPMLCTYDDFLGVVQKYYRVAGLGTPEAERAALLEETRKSPASIAEQQARESFAAAVSMALMQRVDKIDRLEIGPDVPARVAALVGTGDEGLAKLVSVLGGSPPLAVTALWTANTSAYGIQEGVDNLPMTVVLLGDQGINLLASNARRMSPAMDKHLAILTKHARRVGEAAAVLAKATGRAIPNVAQCAGALYPIGSFVLAALDPAEYMKIDPVLVGRARVEAEREVFGAGHEEVGGRLLGRWHMPTNIFEAVRCYIDPFDAGDCYDLAAILQVAVASITAEGVVDDEGLKGVADTMESLELDAAAVKTTLAHLNG